MPRSRLPLAAILLAFSIVCIRLGVWQLDRLSARRSANALASARRALPEARYPAALPADSLEGRRVKATGTYDRAREVLLRGQVFGGVPGVALVTPLRPGGADTAVLVERGFVPSPDALTLPADTGLDEPGVREVHGIAGALGDSGAGQPLERNGHLTLRRLDIAALRAWVPYPVSDIVIRQTPGPSLPSLPRRRPAPPLDEGPHRMYAFQWFAFALTALVFGAVFLRKGGNGNGEEQMTGRRPPAPRAES
jgi:surfeit locus 1 family protein